MPTSLRKISTCTATHTYVVSFLVHAKISNFRPSNDNTYTYAFDLEMAQDGTVTMFVEDDMFEDLCGNPNIRSNIITVTQGTFLCPY